MEIIVSNHETSVPFEDISVGTGFKWRKWYYMKIETCTVETRMSSVKSANAVCFDGGLLAYFAPTENVNLIPMSVLVDA